MAVNSEFSWVDAVGFQHEVMHTGVLAELLREGGETACTVAGKCLGAPVARVHADTVKLESRAGRRRIADLVVDVELEDGERVRLAVETKVDSSWSVDQLQGTLDSRDGDRGCLLAVGLSGIAVSQKDLDGVDELEHGWRLIDARGWADLLRLPVERSDSPALAEYHQRVEREAKTHESAREAARAGLPLPDEPKRRNGVALLHWAFFAEVLGGLPDAGYWHRSALISGPLLTRWGWFASDPAENAGVYLELMGHHDGRRTLNVKTWATRRLAELQAALDEALAAVLGSPGHRVGSGSKRRTVARVPLPSDPSSAAQLVLEWQGHLDVKAKESLRRVFS